MQCFAQLSHFQGKKLLEAGGAGRRIGCEGRMMDLIEDIFEQFRRHLGADYGGERVTQLHQTFNAPP